MIQLELFKTTKYYLTYEADSYNKKGYRDHKIIEWKEEFDNEYRRDQVYKTINLDKETYKNIKRWNQ